MNRRAFLANLTATLGTLALAACRSAAPTPTLAPSPSATASSGVAAVPSATTAPTVAPSPVATPTLAATPTRSQPATPPGPPPTMTVAPAGTPGPGGARPLPLFDTHVHYSQDAWDPIPIPKALELMDLSGTQVAMVSSTPDEGTIRLHTTAPGRIVPILRPYRTRDDMTTWHRDPAIVRYLEERLALGVHRGIGEFHLYGEDARSEVIGQIVRLAGQRSLLLHAHSDVAAIEILFERAPDARILWAHAGFAEPATLRQMVERYPRLWVETAIRGEIGAGGALAPAWRDLFLAHPDRFMIGTDSYIVSRWVAMPTILGDVRAWCQGLPVPVGEQVAWRNAARLMGVSEVPFRGD